MCTRPRYKCSTMRGTLDDETVQNVLLGPNNIYGAMTLATGATPGYGVEFFRREVDAYFERQQRRRDGAIAAKKAHEEEKDKEDKRQQAAKARKEKQAAARAAKQESRAKKERNSATKADKNQPVKKSTRSASSGAGSSAPARPTTPSSSTIDRPRRFVAPGYAASRHDYAPSLATVVDKSYAERKRELEAKRLAAAKKRASVLDSVSSAARDGAVESAADNGIGGAVESPQEALPVSDDTRPAVKRTADDMAVVGVGTFAAVGEVSSSPSSSRVSVLNGGMPPANGSGSDGAVGSVGLPRLSTPVTTKRSTGKRSCDARTESSDEAAAVGGPSTWPSTSQVPNVNGRVFPETESSSHGAVGRIGHRGRSTSAATRRSGAKRCSDEITVSFDEVAPAGTSSSGQTSGEALGLDRTFMGTGSSDSASEASAGKRAHTSTTRSRHEAPRWTWDDALNPTSTKDAARKKKKARR